MRRSAGPAQMAAACGRPGPRLVRAGRRVQRQPAAASRTAASQLKSSVHNPGNVNVAKNGLSWLQTAATAVLSHRSPR